MKGFREREEESERGGFGVCDVVWGRGGQAMELREIWCGEFAESEFDRRALPLSISHKGCYYCKNLFNLLLDYNPLPFFDSSLFMHY